MFNDEVSNEEKRLEFFWSIPKATGPISVNQFGSAYLLKTLAEICDANGIDYWLFGGTLLGALRHKGYVPWDDDIDIVILRKDVNNLYKALEGNKYFDLEILYNSHWADKILKFRFIGKKWPVYIDIFTFEYCKGEPEVVWKHLLEVKEQMRSELRALEEKHGFHYNGVYNVKPEHLVMINEVFDKYKAKESYIGITEEETDQLVIGYDSVICYNLQVFNKSCFYPIKRYEFCGERYSSFGDYMTILERCFKKPFTLPNDMVAHRHTQRMSPEAEKEMREYIELIESEK